MKKMKVLLLGIPLTLMTTGVSAEITQNCILEGTVDKKQAAARGQSVYVQFHAASSASEDATCNLSWGKKLAFKEPKNAMIEKVPDGSEVTYLYIEEDNKPSEWRLLSVTMR